MSICIHITDVYRDLNLRHQVVWEPTTKQDLKRECWRRPNKSRRGCTILEEINADQ
jgi:hypothetical protein